MRRDHRRMCVTFFVLVGAVVAATPVRAQGSRVGVTAAYPGSVGLLWQVADQFALRPDVTFSQTSGDTTTAVAAGPNAVATARSSNDTWNVTVGASALFYLHDWEMLRAYVSPRGAYTRGAINTTNLITSSNVPTSDHTTTSGYLVSASFGAQYALGKRFGVYGETGLAFTDSTTKTTPTFSASARGFGSRSGVGAIFWF